MMQKLNCSTNVSFATGYINNFVGSKQEENFQILLEKVSDLTFVYCKNNFYWLLLLMWSLLVLLVLCCIADYLNELFSNLQINSHTVKLCALLQMYL